MKSTKVIIVVALTLVLISSVTLYLYLQSKKSATLPQPVSLDSKDNISQLLEISPLNIIEYNEPNGNVTYEIHGTLAGDLYYQGDRVLFGELIIEGDTSKFPLTFIAGVKGNDIQFGKSGPSNTTFTLIKTEKFAAVGRTSFAVLANTGIAATASAESAARADTTVTRIAGAVFRTSAFTIAIYIWTPAAVGESLVALLATIT